MLHSALNVACSAAIAHIILSRGQGKFANMEHDRQSKVTKLLQVPVVIRGPGGVGRQLGAEHSQRLESYFQSIPGVQLVACSTTANAKALLKSAIRSDNPIIFFEHVLLYNVKGACWVLP